QETGFDNCEAGYTCFQDVCTEICTRGATETCAMPEEQNCGRFEGLFDEFEEFGVCVPACDPVGQDCEAAAQGCYFDRARGEAICADVPEQAVELTQDDACYGP